jgi:hypothetical protein
LLLFVSVYVLRLWMKHCQCHLVSSLCCHISLLIGEGAPAVDPVNVGVASP